MKIKMFLLCTLLLCVMGVAQVQGISHCFKYLINPNPHQLLLTHRCPSGLVQWNHPQGAIQLKADMADPYSICIFRMYKDKMSKLIDLTGGEGVELAVPLDGEPTCMTSSGGETILKIETTFDVTDLFTYFRYSLTPLE